MRKKNRIAACLVGLLLVYGAVAGGLYLAQRSLIYYPDRAAPAPKDYGVADAIVRKIATEDGLTLTGWYWPPLRPGAPVIVWYHGNAGHYGDRLSVVPAYQAKGYGVLLAGYRGYAGNPGSPSEAGLYRDARAWIRFMREEGFAPQQIVVYGESLGTGVAVQMALEHPDLRALVLQAPYTSLPDVAAESYFFLPLRLMMKDQFRSIDKIADIKTRLLVFQSSEDRIIPPALSQRLYDAARVDKKLIQFKGFGHNDMPVQERADALADFIAH